MNIKGKIFHILNNSKSLDRSFLIKLRLDDFDNYSTCIERKKFLLSKQFRMIMIEMTLYRNRY